MTHPILMRERDAWIGRTPQERFQIGFLYDRHKEQVDKQGEPYHLHLRQTALLVHPNLRVAAYGHDVLEDTRTTPSDLYDAGFTPYDVNLIIALTKNRHESRLDYLVRVRRNVDAVRIKIADVMSNLSRVSTLDNDTRDRLYSKYYETLTFLAGVTPPKEK